MNIPIEYAKAARATAMRSKPLRSALEDWYKHKGSCPFPEEKSFLRWIERLADHVAGQFHDEGLVTEKNIVEGLKVQAIGDKLALRLAKKAARAGYETDTNCYIEEGVVFANVWIASDSFEKSEKRADGIAAEFRKAGYSAELWVDEEDNRACTVNAQIDFKLYVKKGGQK